MPPRICGVVRLGAGDGDVLQVVQRVQLILRRLDHDGIGHAILGIEPEGGRDLDAAGQIDHHASW